MFLRALAVWGLLLCLAVLNGGLRERWLVPALGPLRVHQVSTLLLSGFILGATRATSGWLALAGVREALLVGTLWLGLTLAFEFLAGHFLFHRPWPVLLADYDLSQGRIWILVLVVTFLAPALCRRAP
ncbi:MAG TPA: hypothetical protein VG712_05250 [Gemmatimonadales bacterium]|nr:hypothetical protein [Gemmatimonadales bacterium]